MPRLADVAEINPRLDRSAIGDVGELVSFVPMASVSEELGVITSEQHRSVGDVIKGFTPFQDRDVLVAKITPCFENGKIAHARIGKRLGFGSTEFHVIRPVAEKLDDRYLYHFLRQPHIRVEGERRMTGSAGQRRVPKAYLEALEIPLPLLPEQRRIAAILDKADALRAKRREAIAKLDQLLQSVFLEMFGDPVKNPFNWPVMGLGEFISEGPQNGIYKPATDYGSGVPILRIDGFRAGDVIEKLPAKRVRLDGSEVQKYGLRTGDLIINRVNSPEHLGKPALIAQLSEATVFESNMMRFSLDTDRLMPDYLLRFLLQDFVRDQIARRRKDAVNQSSINQGDLLTLVISVPPIDLQRKFGHLVKRIAEHRTKVVAASRQFDDLFNALQHQAFSGSLAPVSIADNGFGLLSSPCTSVPADLDAANLQH